MSFEFSELREGILDIFDEAHRAQWVGHDIGVRVRMPQKAQETQRVRRPPFTRAERRERRAAGRRSATAVRRAAREAKKATRLAADAARKAARSPQRKISICAACGARSEAHRCAA